MAVPPSTGRRPPLHLGTLFEFQRYSTTHLSAPLIIQSVQKCFLLLLDDCDFDATMSGQRRRDQRWPPPPASATHHYPPAPPAEYTYLIQPPAQDFSLPHYGHYPPAPSTQAGPSRFLASFPPSPAYPPPPHANNATPDHLQQDQGIGPSPLASSTRSLRPNSPGQRRSQSAASQPLEPPPEARASPTSEGHGSPWQDDEASSEAVDPDLLARGLAAPDPPPSSPPSHEDDNGPRTRKRRRRRTAAEVPRDYATRRHSCPECGKLFAR